MDKYKLTVTQRQLDLIHKSLLHYHHVESHCDEELINKDRVLLKSMCTRLRGYTPHTS